MARNSDRPQSSQIAYKLLPRSNWLVLISRSSRWFTTLKIKNKWVITTQENYSWTQAGILLVFHLSDPYFHWKRVSVHLTASFLTHAEAAEGGICSLKTSSLTNLISVAEFLATSTGTFFCFWIPLNFDIFFDNSFSEKTVFDQVSHLFGYILVYWLTKICPGVPVNEIGKLSDSMTAW